MAIERLNVLSIDWDYFIDATTEERLRLFPDGGNENLSMTLQDIIWSGRYGVKELLMVKTDSKAIRFVKNVLKRTDAKYMIVDSHKHAYDFIMESMREFDRDSLNLVNIDYHHDLYDNGDNVDCGNWLDILMRNTSKDSVYTWVHRGDSDMEHGHPNIICTTDLGIVDEYEWDIVFICRSGMWSPPHLDEKFRNMFHWIVKCYPTQYQKGIFTDRYRRVRKVCEEFNDIKVFQDT